MGFNGSHLVIIAVIVLIEITSAQYPDVPCEGTYKCISSVSQNDCPINEFLELDITVSCCPRCRKGLDRLEENCDTGPNTACSPGLQCQLTAGNNICSLNKNLCSYTYHLPHLKQLPKCEIDGTFAAKQCKGDKTYGRCFCYNEQGQRIYGIDWWKDADNMTCACSRFKEKLEAQGTYSTLHCSPNGNYEPLQCNDGICWCADPMTGLVINESQAVPESMWKILSCYDQRTMGQQYLRQCEAARYAQYLQQKALLIHGTNTIVNTINCDYDGNYGPYSVLSKYSVICTWIDGSRITPYETNLAQSADMNCNCARDIKYFEAAGLELPLICNGFGNYDPIQQSSKDLWYCVDRDGFAVTDYVNSAPENPIYCNQFLYYEQ